MSKQVTLFNKGNRSFQLPEGILLSMSTIDVEPQAAEKYLKAYSGEIIKGGKPSDNDGKSEQKVKELKASLKEVQAKNEKLEKENKELSESVELLEDHTKELEESLKEMKESADKSK